MRTRLLLSLPALIAVTACGAGTGSTPGGPPSPTPRAAASTPASSRPPALPDASGCPVPTTAPVGAIMPAAAVLLRATVVVDPAVAPAGCFRLLAGASLHLAVGGRALIQGRLVAPPPASVLRIDDLGGNLLLVTATGAGTAELRWTDCAGLPLGAC